MTGRIRRTIRVQSHQVGLVTAMIAKHEAYRRHINREIDEEIARLRAMLPVGTAQ